MSPPSVEVTVTEPPRRFPSGYVDGVRPSHHLNNSKTRFTNPWPSFRIQTFSQWVSFFFKVTLRTPDLPQNVKSLIPTQTPTWGSEVGNQSSAKATWLGHACYLVELPTPPGATRGVRIIFDPVFSNRCSPFQRLGPARYTDTPCKVEEIPAVDAVVLSHNHYDQYASSLCHSESKPIDNMSSTDIPTLRTIFAKPSSSAHMFVALNNAAYLSKAIHTPLSRVHELDWWDERILHVALPSDTGGPAVNTEVRLSCTPSQHVSGRTVTDRWHALWAAWVVDDLQSQKKVYFAGDTGYRTVSDGEDEEKVPVCPAFAEVGERFGGVDVALLPIGAYSPRAIMSNMHASPSDAVRIFKDVRAKKALAMHWGTWVLTSEPVLEPPALLKTECEKAGFGPDDFLVPALGETVFF
ncbi:N-acyl-phosphatidylethanolamine-hydrolyzing phospholipase D [Multifurca ochricompacta]|uniref:N-acyl-phosphatidylethanolamine-hydrolyzing phospholipase D n=1 Tax=Multifurca ochricompacta TaxID=376703 RepID=A0AAD4M7S0_9AGAM|nr:N-acyl-phosphatidylethanolamine-hydrolyzing phospholipase D [Multifurca ochricompacta]